MIHTTKKTKLKTYQVTWEERHWVPVKARTPEEAEKKFRNGQYPAFQIETEITRQPEAFLEK